MKLLWLTLFTGLAGLGSQSLYFKLLDYSLGSAPVLAFIIVASFILGQGLGSWFSIKIKQVALIEFALALYNLVWVLGHEALEKAIASSLQSLGFLGVDFSSSLIGLGLISFPAIALGMTFPALVELNKSASKAYGIHALGSFLGIVLMETLFPFLGMFNLLLLLSVIHLVNGLILFPYKFQTMSLPKIKISPKVIGLGTITGIIQGSFLMLIPLLFQPFYFINSFVVLSFILGLSLGSYWYHREKFLIENALTNICIGLILSLLMISLSLNLPLHYFSLPMVIFGILLIISIVSVPIGTLFPALMNSQYHRSSTVSVNLSLSLGNFIGMILAYALSSFTPVFDLLLSMVIILFVLTLKLFITHFRSKLVETAIASICFIFAISTLKEEKLLQLSTSPNYKINKEIIFKRAGELVGIYDMKYHSYNEAGSPKISTERRLYQNGFSPIDLNEGLESAISVVGSAYTKGRENALVIGIGSGRSAGTTALFFNHTDVLDISPAVKDLVLYLKDQNFSLLTNPKAQYHEMDGIIAPWVLEKKYDLIVLTVDPGYHLQASKLYTKEYFSKLKNMLTPSGVMIFWLDQSLTNEAQQVLINSAKENFNFQKLSYIHTDKEVPTYYLVVNSQEELNFKNFETHISEGISKIMNEGEKREFNLKFSETTKTNSIFKPHPSIIFSGFHRGDYGK